MSFATTLSGSQAVDLSALIRRRAKLGPGAVLLYTASGSRKARFSRANWRWPTRGESDEHPHQLLRPIRAEGFSFTVTTIDDSAVSAREARNLRPKDHLKFWALRAAVGARGTTGRQRGHFRFPLNEVQGRRTEGEQGREGIPGSDPESSAHSQQLREAVRASPALWAHGNHGLCLNCVRTIAHYRTPTVRSPGLTDVELPGLLQMTSDSALWSPAFRELEIRLGASPLGVRIPRPPPTYAAPRPPLWGRVCPSRGA